MNDKLPENDEPAEDSFVALFARLVDDAERFVRAEFQLYRAQLFARVKQARVSVIMLVIAFSLGQAAVIALLVGLVATLRRPLGPAWATAVVVFGALALAGVLARLAIGQLRAVTDLKDRQP